jgi:regulator of protease activity HflC (stomatin/prohibitin superfamily)
MEQNIQRKGLVNWLALLLLGSVGGILAAYTNSATGVVGAVFMGLGLIVAITAYLQMRLEERERLEALEFADLQKKATDSSLFAEQAADTFPAKHARMQFEKFFVPGVAILLLLIQAASAWLLWGWVANDQPPTAHQSTVAITLYALLALLYFQLGKYSAVFARLEKLRLLRPQASYLLLGSLLSAVVTGVEIAAWAGHPEWDAVAARVLAALLGLVAVENLITLVFEIYRPRLRGQEAHPLYESRLIGILSQPGGLIRTAAQALDYQFGFKVSETWFYRFLEKAFAWLLLFQIAVLLLSTTVVIIPVGEQALLERFGKPVGDGVLNPGWHLKLPWPFSKVYRYETTRVQSFTLGVVTDKEYKNQRTLLWSKPHVKEEANMLVASRIPEEVLQAGGDRQTPPVNLISVSIPVLYEIQDLRAYAYNVEDAGALLKDLANAELTRYLVSVDFDQLMGPGRQAAARELRARIQKQADQHQLGVHILFVGLHGIHPPVKVAPDFENVIGALQDAEATNLLAQAYAAEVVPKAHANATKMVNQAAAEQFRLVSLATAQARRFTNQLTAYQAAPDVYRMLVRLDTVSRSITNARKYVVVPTNSHEVVTFNFEDKIRPDLLDVKLPSQKK